MAQMTHDTIRLGGRDAAHRARVGFTFAVVSALSFGLSGALATPLLASGWSPGAVVAIRIGVGCLVLLPFAARDLGGWSAMRVPTLRSIVVGHGRTIAAYGLLGIAGAQFCYFSAIQRMDVGPALLIEYTAPVVVIAWMWAVHRQRPSRWAFLGVAICAVGLVLVLDLIGRTSVDLVGALWAGAAMVGAAGYFIISAHTDDSLPPSVLATAGMVFAVALLGILGVVGVLPMSVGAASVHFAGFDESTWVVLIVLGVITAATAYLTGIAAARRLGARLASLFALLEVVAAVVWAAALLGQIPTAAQFVGGALIILGVIAAKIGEQGSPSAIAEICAVTLDGEEQAGRSS
ncbi:EamA family transporter [Gordonia jinhuaensis]|uniref:Membrane protein n=1 Tax=Gordonia jinhuaensis TaxID=1517702 RepID=A0A916TG77_9ACTN|nr:EamA family transporter [Gordonia jinhuaensis]GGB44130.1 membrane protein [Gordonia jinhuaensis]